MRTRRPITFGNQRVPGAGRVWELWEMAASGRGAKSSRAARVCALWVSIGLAHMCAVTSMLPVTWSAHTCQERGAQVLVPDLDLTENLTIGYVCFVSKRKLALGCAPAGI